MRNRKFRLSHMIPNAWFYKLQEFSTGKRTSSKNHWQPPPPPPPPQSSTRKSYYFNRELKSNHGFSINSPPPPPLPPTNSLKHHKPRARTSSRSPSPPPQPEFRTDNIPSTNYQSLQREIAIDMSLKNCDLPPIITNRNRKTENLTGGVRLRNHSPRIGMGKMKGRKSTSSRRGVSNSLAISKASEDPEREFRESMVEMIVENKMRTLKDLEELLACYLCLNADEYHDLIIHVFKQIWFDLTQPAF